jgi:hypothetical protein
MTVAPTAPVVATRGHPDREGPRRDGPIVVIGGYGAVGRTVAAALAPALPGRVVVAGRHGGAAWACARRLGDGVRAARVDATRPDEVARLVHGAAAVVMCVEAGNAEVARLCLGHGVPVVDVSATAAVLDAVVRLDGAARAAGAAAVLSVGLAPGITNLLARCVVARLPDAARIDLTLGLGLGDEHGGDARRWAVRGLGTPTPPGIGARAVDLPGFGRRVAHPFPFSDQHTLSRSLGLPVVTRLCFDQRSVTAALFGLRRARAFAGPRRQRTALAADRALARLRLGGTSWVAHARAVASDGRSAEVAVRGHGDARVTAGVAAAVVRRVVIGDVPPGVHHLDEVVEPVPFLAELGLEPVGPAGR